MIQRIQSVWLFVAALLNACLFFTAIYKADILVNNVSTPYLMQVNSPGNFMLLILAVIMTLLPLVAIFLFKNRKQQRNLVLLSIIANIGFIALMLMSVTNYNHTAGVTNGRYWFGSVLPVVSIVFLVMALNGIRKDQKLLKSLDRLR